MVSARRAEVEFAAEPLSRRARRQLRCARTDLGHVVTVIGAHDFRQRGWLLAEAEGGTAVSSVTQVEPGQRLRLRFRDGRVGALAEDIETDETNKEER